MHKMFSGLFLVVLLSVLGSTLCAMEDLIDTSIDMDLLREAWRYPAGGSRGKPYYKVTVNGEFFDGERDWSQRWDMIKDALPYSGIKILELGSNFAIASAYLIKYRDAQSAVGIELPNERLRVQGNPKLVESARVFHKALGLSNLDMRQVDLDSADYENLLGTDYDLAICMSILKWVEDPARLLKYLSHFSYIIYEGHEPDELEIKRFLSHGFTKYKILGSSIVGVSYTAGQRRTVILFSKE